MAHELGGSGKQGDGRNLEGCLCQVGSADPGVRPAPLGPLWLSIFSHGLGARGGLHASGFGVNFGTGEFEMCRILLNL